MMPESSEMEKPDHALVSVIICSGSCQELFAHTLNSVQRQTYSNIEIILPRDDQNNGWSANICKDRVLLLSDPAPASTACWVNLALANASGMYVAILLPGDTWQPSFLEKCVYAIERSHADFVFSNWIVKTSHGERKSIYETVYYWWENREKRSLPGWRLMNWHAARYHFLTECFTPSCSLLLRRGSLSPKNPMHHGQGWLWDLILQQVLYSSCRVLFTMDPLAFQFASLDEPPFVKGSYDENDEIQLFKKHRHAMSGAEVKRFKQCIRSRHTSRTSWLKRLVTVFRTHLSPSVP